MSLLASFVSRLWSPAVVYKLPQFDRLERAEAELLLQVVLAQLKQQRTVDVVGAKRRDESVQLQQPQRLTDVADARLAEVDVTRHAL